MSTTFTDIIVSNTANIASGNITNLQANNITANELVCDSVIFDNLINTSNTLTLNGSVINIGNSGSQVNIIGSTTFLNTTNTNIKDNLITLNKGGLSAVNSGIEIEDTGSIIASLKLDSNKDFIITSPNNKLTVDNIATTNITGVSTVSVTTANITTLNVSGNSILGDAITDITTVNGQLKFDNGLTKKIALFDTSSNDFQYVGFNVASAILGYNLSGTSSSHVFYAGVTSTTKQELLRINGTKANSTSKITGTIILPTNSGIGCGGDIYATNLNASGSITGTISTAAQPNITSVGTLTSLNISTSITSSSLSTGSIVGTISSASASQPNITSLGLLTSLSVAGDISIDTNTLKVDSVSNRVGINNASPLYPLDVIGTIKNNGDIISTGTVVCTTLDATNISLDTITSTTINNTGVLTNTGNLIVNGNTTLGDAATDIISIPGTVRHRNNMIGFLFNNSGPASYPILCSISAFGTSPLYPDDALDGAIVYPGFKIITYQNSAYTGTAITIDATLSTVPIYASTIAAGTNTISSMRVYYMNTEIIITGL